jgi:hypothetical protein
MVEDRIAFHDLAFLCFAEKGGRPLPFVGVSGRESRSVPVAAIQQNG